MPGAAGAETGGAPTLPTVLIIGGSNSIRYTPEVAAALAGTAAVQRVPDNARSTSYTLEHLERWLGGGRWPLVYFNWGMHDLTRRDGEKPQVPLARYVANLETLVPRLVAVADRLLWATTMTMLPERQPLRSADDIVAYNAAAAEIVTRHGIAIHDLYGFTAERHELFGADGLHFTPDGYRALGLEVGRAIAAALVAAETPRG